MPEEGTSVNGIKNAIKEKLATQADQVVIYATSRDVVNKIDRPGDPAKRIVLLGQTPGERYDSGAKREREKIAVLKAAAAIDVLEGRSNQAISDRLFLSPKTVDSHIRSIFAKLGLALLPETNRRVLAVLAYLRSYASASAAASPIESSLPAS